MWFLHLLLLLLAPAACTVPLRDLQGGFDSPDYPQGYPNDASQSWEIEVPSGYGIKLTFAHVDIEPSADCEYDYVQVFSDEALYPPICGTKSRDGKRFQFPQEYYTSGEWMRVTFRSDFSNEERYTGFSAYYTAVDINECEESNPCSHFCNNFIGGFHCSCRPGYFLQENQRLCGVECSGEVFTRFKGLITSPNYPAAYAENSQCGYRIQIEAGFEVVLSFAEDFDVEGDPAVGCRSDVLKITSGGKEYGPFCGEQAPRIRQPLGNVVDISFHTDERGENKGWKITYSSTAKQCPVDIFENNIVQPRASEYDYKDVVSVSCVKGYELYDMRRDEHLKSAAVLCQKDGTWNSSLYSCRPVDCGNPITVRNSKENFTSTVYKCQNAYICNEPYYKLRGNALFECSADAEWVAVTGGDTALPRCEPVCGRSGLPAEHGRILGGRRAKPGYFPWQVRLETREGGRGAGALISDGWVLTAAHLFDGSPLAEMYAGVVSLARIPGERPYLPARVLVHPGYAKQRAEGSRRDFDHDIALVRLRREAELGPRLSPLCLPGEATPAAGKLGYIAGWGKTEDRSVAVILQYAQVPVVPMAKCEGLDYQGLMPTFTSNMICAGQPGTDSCQGDSGGPYVFTDPRDPTRHVAEGIVSFGPQTCGSYGVYTHVGKHLDWIRKTMEEQEALESEEADG